MLSRPHEFHGAKGKLLELAESHALLTDPAQSQHLILAAWRVFGQDGLQELMKAVFVAGGIDQFFSFQLLYNQMHSSAQLRRTQGEHSRSEQILDEIIAKMKNELS
jgi:hypothetical protein